MGRTAWVVVVAAACAVALSASMALAGAAPAGEPLKEVGIRGVVERGAAEGSLVIKVAFGQKKVIAYEIPPDCAKAKELGQLLGKMVEAKGVMKKGPNGENVFVLSDCAPFVAAR